MDQDFLKQAYEWNFPEVDLEAQTDLDESLQTIDKDVNQDTYSKQELAELERNRELELRAKENSLLRDEIEVLKTNFQSQVEVMVKLVNKLRNPVSIIDEEIVELLQDIIKKLTKRIICKEISAAPETLTQMINELRSLIEAKNGLIAIHLSNNDHSRLDALKNQFSGIACIDNNLNDGDIIIKSNFGEVRALLNERIEQLIRVEHD